MNRWFFFSRWRIRIGKLGIGWRAAAWSTHCRYKRFRNQAEPVRVLRAMHVWLQWGRV